MSAKIKLNAASGGGSVSLEAPTSTTGNANVEFKLPVADGSSGQALTTNASGQLAFATVSTAIQTTSGTDNFTIADGNLVIGTAGHGIDFSASGGPSGSGNELLDDYEEGTFTPTFTFSPTDVTNESYSIQTGHYVKVGRIVFFRLEVQLSNKGTLSSGAGYCQIAGLPIQSADYAGVSIGIYQHFDNYQPAIVSVGTSEQVYIAQDPSLSSNTSSQDLQHTHLRDNSRINIGGTYYASA